MESVHVKRSDVWEKWLGALRGGTYRQGASKLRSIGVDNYLSRGETLHCCLGVGCDILGVEWFEPGVLDDTSTSGEESFGYVSLDRGYLPKWAQLVFGFDTHSPKVLVNDKRDEASLGYVADLNDSGDWNFTEIAERLEATFPELVNDDTLVKVPKEFMEKLI